MLEVAIHGEAAPVDAWGNLSEIDDRTCGGRRGSAVFDAEAPLALLAVDAENRGHGRRDERSVALDDLVAGFGIHGHRLGASTVS